MYRYRRRDGSWKTKATGNKRVIYTNSSREDLIRGVVGAVVVSATLGGPLLLTIYEFVKAGRLIQKTISDFKNNNKAGLIDDLKNALLPQAGRLAAPIIQEVSSGLCQSASNSGMISLIAEKGNIPEPMVADFFSSTIETTLEDDFDKFVNFMVE